MNSFFLICGLVPLLPFVAGLRNVFWVASAVTCVLFVLIGALKAHWSIRPWWHSGITTLGIGGGTDSVASLRKRARRRSSLKGSCHGRCHRSGNREPNPHITRQRFGGLRQLSILFAVDWLAFTLQDTAAGTPISLSATAFAVVSTESMASAVRFIAAS